LNKLFSLVVNLGFNQFKIITLFVSDWMLLRFLSIEVVLIMKSLSVFDMNLWSNGEFEVNVINKIHETIPISPFKNK